MVYSFIPPIDPEELETLKDQVISSLHQKYQHNLDRDIYLEDRHLLKDEKTTTVEEYNNDAIKKILNNTQALTYLAFYSGRPIS